MGLPLNNVTTAAEYTAANTLVNIPACPRLTIDVFNAAIFWQARICLDPIENGGQWEPEIFMGPSSRTIARHWITGIRVRSAVAAAPAQVTIEAIPQGQA